MNSTHTYSVAFLTRTARTKGKDAAIYCRIQVASTLSQKVDPNTHRTIGRHLQP